MTFEFNSRETYLEYRRQWKEKYFEIVLTIRKLKQELKDEMRKYSKGESTITKLWEKH